MQSTKTDHFNIIVKDADKIDHLAVLVDTYRLLQRLKKIDGTQRITVLKEKIWRCQSS
jgi:DNA transposition AAA+ family ATPase